MDSLLLINYFEKQAKVSSHLQELMAQVTKCLLRKEEQRSLEKSLQQETLTLTMDVYEMEGVSKQLKLQYDQQSAGEESINTIYKYAIQFCTQIQNIDWNAQMHCKLELMQLQCQNELRELSEEYEMAQKRRSELQQRPIVQMAHTAQKELVDVEAKMNQSKQTAFEHQTKLLDRLTDMRNERNATIVYLVEGSKKIVDLNKEIEDEKSSHEHQRKELLRQKQELISKLQKHSAKLPDASAGNIEDKESLPQVENAPVTITKLEPFPNMGNGCNATTVCAEQKKLSFVELFKEWGTKRQLQFPQIMTNAANMFPEKSPITPPKEILSTSLTVSNISINHINEPLTNVCIESTPRSVSRRPYEDESDTLFIPKKRVRLTDQEVVESNDTFFSEAVSNEIESAYSAKENEIENRGNATFVIEQSTEIPSKSDTETIEIFSTGEMEKRETMRAEELTKQKVNKPVFVKANKLLKKAKLMGSQKMTSKVFKSCKSRVGNGKSKIEIQECRIIKPAGTKLPTKLPIDLPQEEQAIKSPKSRNSSTNASPATKIEVKIFKSPQRPPKRKAAKLSDCDVYFRKFLQQQSDSEENNKTGKTTAAPLLEFDKSSHTKEEKSKPKRRKTETDFDRFFRETPNKGSDESDNDPSMLGEAVISKESDDGFLQFSTKLDEGSAFFGSNVDDFFAGPSNNEKDDGNFLSFDFDGEGTRKTDDFL
ncbi:restin homolog [Eurosta solidaginis]|uniref:restin homolog n=1 Tax=Eurosta solidaginis TaxID=178769 RepID=UPI0035317732